MAPVIDVRGLVKSFGAHRVLDGLDLAVGPGERVALLGLNGAGKTTLLRCLMGVLSFEGVVRLGAVDVSTAGKEARRRIGYVPQRPPLFSMSLGATVEFFASIREIPAEAVARRLDELGLSLEEKADLPIGALSGGMLQKALLALALAADPPLLLLDEPTANLDPRARRDFLRALRRVPDEATVLLASHRLEEVETVASRVWILHRGGIAFDGSVAELRARAGAESWLWVRTTGAGRDRVEARFGRYAAAEDVVANGTRVGVRLAPTQRMEALRAIQDAEIPVDDFWVEAPSLEEIVTTFFTERES